MTLENWLKFTPLCVFVVVALTVMKMLDLVGFGWNVVAYPVALWGAWTAVSLLWLLVTGGIPAMYRSMKAAIRRDWNGG